MSQILTLTPDTKLVIATHNDGKLREIRDILAPFTKAENITSAGELGLPEPVEDGDSFVANANIKSLASAKAANMLALADDSGLEVDALDGKPGIHSARWAGESKNFTNAMNRIGSELELAGLHPIGQRARFVCVLSLSAPDGNTLSFRGAVEGALTFPMRGDKGFGYDPIFIPDGHNITFAEMDQAQKHTISHRASAFAKLLQYMQSVNA